MGDEMAKLKVIADDLKRTLVELDLNLGLYYDDDLTPLEKGIFVDFKICQQNALNYTESMLRILKSLNNN